MDRKFWAIGLVLALGALLLVVTAMSAAADPADISNEPTEPWIFDEGKNTTIKSKTWEIRYDITVTGGSRLIIAACDWTFNSSDPFRPVGIILEEGYLEFNQSNLRSADGSPGFYIEARDTLKIIGGELKGMARNPSTGYGITIIDAEADLSFLDINGTEGAGGIYSRLSNVTLYECDLRNIDSNAIAHDTQGSGVGRNYTFEMIYTDIHDIGGNAVYLLCTDNHGETNLNTLFVNIYNIGSYGIYLYNYYDYYGDGNINLNLNHTKIHHISSYGMYFYNYYRNYYGSASGNRHRLNFTNTELSNTSSYGIYLYNYYTNADYNMSWNNFTLQDTGSSYGMYLYMYSYNVQVTGEWNAVDSKIVRCGYYGFYNYAYRGGWTRGISFKNCLFSDMTNYGFYMYLYYYDVHHVIFDGCTIQNMGTYGTYFYAYYTSCPPIQFINSSTHNNGQAGLYVYSSAYTTGFGVNVTNSRFEHEPGPGVYFRPYYIEGQWTFNIVDSWFNDTGGVWFENYYGSYQTPGTLKVNIINTTFENTTGSAVRIQAQVYYSAMTTKILVENTTIKDSDGDGLYVMLGVYSTYRHAHNADVKVLNSTFLDVRGSAMWFSDQDPTLGGTREFYVYNVTVRTAARSIFVTGMDGGVWWSTFRDVLKEDVFLMGGHVRLYYCDFVTISDRKFVAATGGTITFIFDLQITVKWNTGAPAIGATVKISDNKQKLISVQSVREADGRLPVLTLEPHTVREIGIFSQAPYVVNVTFLEISKTVGVRLERNEEITILIEDYTEPDVMILYPKQGHIQQTTTLEVRGSAWDSQSGVEKVEVSLDGRNWVEAHGSPLRWNATLEATPEQIKEFGGLFNLRARATDFALNEHVETVIIRIDPTPPELNVDFPYDGYVTKDAELWVRGVTEIGSTVKINGIPANVVVSMFNHMVTLYEGQNSISVVSIDPLGNIQIVQLTVYLDTQDPFFILISPEEDEMTNQEELIVEAQVEDNLRITINDQPVVYGSDEYPRGEGMMLFPVPLSPGQNDLVIRVEDSAGNMLHIERTITLDKTPPWINVFSPQDGQFLSRPEVTIKGTVETSARLFVSDEDVTVRNGYFERVILALEGANNVTLVAFDEAGNQYMETLTIHIDTVDPVMSITEPEEDFVTVTETRYVITGMIEKDDKGMLSGTEILVNGESSTIIDDGDGPKREKIEIMEDGTFSIQVDLQEGRNVYTIEVLDGVGNSVSVTKTVYLDTRAPTLVIYLDPIRVEEDGSFSTSKLILNLTGYTDPGSDLRVLDILLGVDENGRFSMNIDMVPNDVTTIIVTSTDAAGNLRTIEESITHKVGPRDGVEEEEGGTMFLIIALILFILIVVVTIFFVRSQREHYVEMEMAQATPVADLEDLEADLAIDDAGGDEGAAIEEETTVPSPPRPRPHPRRAAAPRPVRAPVPKADEKELTDQGAEADIMADETEQEDE